MDFIQKAFYCLMRLGGCCKFVHFACRSVILAFHLNICVYSLLNHDQAGVDKPYSIRTELFRRQLLIYQNHLKASGAALIFTLFLDKNKKPGQEVFKKQKGYINNMAPKLFM